MSQFALEFFDALPNVVQGAAKPSLLAPEHKADPLAFGGKVIRDRVNEAICGFENHVMCCGKCVSPRNECQLHSWTRNLSRMHFRKSCTEVSQAVRLDLADHVLHVGFIGIGRLLEVCDPMQAKRKHRFDRLESFNFGLNRSNAFCSSLCFNLPVDRCSADADCNQGANRLCPARQLLVVLQPSPDRVPGHYRPKKRSDYESNAEHHENSFEAVVHLPGQLRDDGEWYSRQLALPDGSTR